MKKIVGIISVLFFLNSCSFIIDALEDNSGTIPTLEKDKLSILMSGNINGETHPCGCRHFPLGGLPQVAGQFHEIKKTNDFFYVDTGDTLFPSSVLPENMKDSLTFGAENLALGLDKIGLSLMVPGDQDFAAGIDWLNKLMKKVKFELLISNLRDKKTIKHREWAVLKKGQHKVFLVGLVSPDVIAPLVAYHFLPMEDGFKRVLKVIKDNGYKEKNPFHRLIVISNAGVDSDAILAKNNQQIDWIMGGHTQSFTKFPTEEGNTKIVQVLSRNHYLGEVTINLNKEKKGDAWKIHEMREDLGKKLTPNEWFGFIDTHKSKMTKIQKEEQSRMAVQVDAGVKLNTAGSCIECHDAQGKFWQGTPHSMAFATLLNSKEENNLNCVGCHSVGLNDARGFSRTQDIIKVQSETIELSRKETKDKSPDELKSLLNRKLEAHKDKYFAEVKKSFGKIKSVRKLSSVQLRKHSRKWDELDVKYQVAHNFQGVQCLNCHDKALEHPFETSKINISRNAKLESIKSKCLDCHDPDQSPEWYSKNEKGLAAGVNKEVLNAKVKKLSCPKYIPR